MIVHRGDDVVGCQRFAVVEFHARAQVENPGRGCVAGLEAFGQFADQFTRLGDFSQVVAAAVDDVGVKSFSAVAGSIESVVEP